MKREEKALAERVLQHLFVGRRICGIHFHTGPILLVDKPSTAAEMRDCFLSIDSAWTLLEKLPASLPELVVENYELGHARRRTSELIAAVGQVAWNTIMDVHLAETVPHLLVSFDNGKVLYINGHHDKFESWNVSAGDFTVVATPGDGVAVWCPDQFRVR